nr:MAG TPA: hypothetical protein [Caudoviricetes sp.]
MLASIYYTTLRSQLLRTLSRTSFRKGWSVSSSESLRLAHAADLQDPESLTARTLDRAWRQATDEMLLLAPVATMISRKLNLSRETKLISLSTDSETSSRNTVLPPLQTCTTCAESLPNTLTRTGAGLRPGTCR